MSSGYKITSSHDKSYVTVLSLSKDHDQATVQVTGFSCFQYSTRLALDAIEELYFS